MRLFIRTEASTAIGMGHFMRCFAIAEEARAQGWEVTFLLNEIRDAVAARIESIGAHGREVAGPLGYEGDFAILHELGVARPDWILVDSYQATEAFIHVLSNAAHVAVMDDLCLLDTYDGDLIINAAEAALAMPYARKSRAKCLLGAAYAQIRREFRHPAMPLVGGPSVTIMFGGSVGEVAAMGLPALVLVVVDNQAAALTACPYPVLDARAGLPEALGLDVTVLMADDELRRALAANAHAVVDGLGAQRIVEAMSWRS